MKIKHFILFAALWALILGLEGRVASAEDGIQLAQNQSLVCFNDCIEENGSDAKGSCARKCGLAGGMEKPKRDCGVEYKTCMKGCDKKDKACKKACRAARTNCF